MLVSRQGAIVVRQSLIYVEAIRATFNTYHELGKPLEFTF
jgi:hypothetical protein